jgi:hypothetical protein
VVGTTFHTEYVGALEPATLTELDEAGWTVHWVHWPVLVRWLRMVYRREQKTLNLSAERLDALCRHTLRHFAFPRELAAIGDARCFLMLRWDRADEPEIRMLLHYPNGVPLPTPGGSVTIARAPGWYSHAMSWSAPVSEGLAGDQFKRAMSQIQGFLRRYPRSTETMKRPELGRLAAFILGFCASELVKLALAVALEAEERRGSSSTDVCP